VDLLIDTLSGERGADVAVEAGVRLSELRGVRPVFIGIRKTIHQYLKTHNRDTDQFQIMDADQCIDMDEFAVDAIHRKPDASVILAMQALQAGRGDAFISPGHSGATVVTARDTLGLLPWIRRPALCQVIPFARGQRGILLDAGATVTATVRDLVLFAAMAQPASAVLLDRENPSIGLLNIGAESCKGNRGLIETHRVLTRTFPDFIGNIEGHDVWHHRCDAVVTDGITGNILLKSSEGLLKALLDSLYPIDPEAAGILTADFSPSRFGGAVLLGVNGVCVVCHGRAGVQALVSAGHIAVQCAKKKLVSRLERNLKTLSFIESTDEELVV